MVKMVITIVAQHKQLVITNLKKAMSFLEYKKSKKALP